MQTITIRKDGHTYNQAHTHTHTTAISFRCGDVHAYVRPFRPSKPPRSAHVHVLRGVGSCVQKLSTSFLSSKHVCVCVCLSLIVIPLPTSLGPSVPLSNPSPPAVRSPSSSVRRFPSFSFPPIPLHCSSFICIYMKAGILSLWYLALQILTHTCTHTQ